MLNLLDPQIENSLDTLCRILRLTLAQSPAKIALGSFENSVLDTECVLSLCARDPYLSKLLGIEPETLRSTAGGNYKNPFHQIVPFKVSVFMFGPRCEGYHGLSDKLIAAARIICVMDQLSADPWALHRSDIDVLLAQRFEVNLPKILLDIKDNSANGRLESDAFWPIYATALMEYRDRHRGALAHLYYEAHITIEPVFDARLETARELASKFGFRVADLLMKKREKDSAERSANDTFMTGHGKYYDDLRRAMAALIHELQTNRFKVWRYKIEDTVVDSRIEDKLNLLTPD